MVGGRYFHIKPITLLMATLFAVTQTWKQFKCIPNDKWENKLWYTPHIHTQQYFFGIGVHNTRGLKVLQWGICKMERQRIYQL
jgi:hypothetical protein